MQTWKLAILFAAVAVAVRAEEEEDGKIVGGSQIPISQAPYQASLVSDGESFCGGSIIANRWILTAAHCVPDMSPSDLEIRVGAADYRNGAKHIVRRIISHPRYNEDTTDYDIALIQVASDMPSGTAKIVPVTTMEPAAGTRCFVSGWGTLYSDGPDTTQLMGVQVSIVARATCQRAYGSGSITSRMICAGQNGKDSCQGDSGGPLVSNGVQVGVVSWGNGCADPGFPGVYTNIAVLRSFITQYVSL